MAAARPSHQLNGRRQSQLLALSRTTRIGRLPTIQRKTPSAPFEAIFVQRPRLVLCTALRPCRREKRCEHWTNCFSTYRGQEDKRGFVARYFGAPDHHGLEHCSDR